MYMQHLQQEDQRRRKLFESTNMVQQPQQKAFTGSHFVGNNLPMTTPEYIRVDQETATPTPPAVDMPKLMHHNRTHTAYRSRVHQFNEKIRSRVYSSTSTTPKPAARTTTSNSKPVEALDYYDMYDEKFDKKKHTEGGILRGVSDFLQNIQDGLTLAQAAFPADKNNFHLKIAVTPPTTTAPVRTNLMFSNDDESLQIGPFVQQFQRKEGPMPQVPSSTTVAPKREVNSMGIESMLQMFGLCQGHAEL